jgi:hypothetical protein
MPTCWLRAHRVFVGIDTRAGNVRRKVREWLVRYAPAEIGATLGALFASAVAAPFAVAAVTAYAGAIGDGVGFYAVLLVRDIHRQPPGSSRGRLASTVRGLLMEFGPAELLDTVVVRPLAMFLFTRWLGDAAAGAVGGKIAADVVFYAIAVTAYELRKHLVGRHIRRRYP